VTSPNRSFTHLSAPAFTCLPVLFTRYATGFHYFTRIIFKVWHFANKIRIFTIACSLQYHGSLLLLLLLLLLLNKESHRKRDVARIHKQEQTVGVRTPVQGSDCLQLLNAQLWVLRLQVRTIKLLVGGLCRTRER
jgi:hypothetical protein